MTGPAAKRGRLRVALQYAFLLSTLVVILHFNVVQPYVLGGASLDKVAARAPAWLRAPVAGYDRLIEGGKYVGLSLLWRMYSPARRRLRQTEWLGLDENDRWVPVSTPDVSLERRGERSWADALFWDFKRARIHDNYFGRRYRENLPQVYVRATRDRIVRKLGFVPRALRATVRSAPIPPPAEKGDWRPEDAVFDTIDWQGVFR